MLFRVLRLQQPSAPWLRRGAVLLVVLGLLGLLLAWLAGGRAPAPTPSATTTADGPGRARAVVDVRVPARAEMAAPHPSEPPPASREERPRPPQAAPPSQAAKPSGEKSALPAGGAAVPPASLPAENVAEPLPAEQASPLSAEALPAPPAAGAERKEVPGRPDALQDRTGAAGAAPDVPSQDASGVQAAVAVPVYPTRVPPAFKLDYELRRGALSGTGEILWRPGEDYLLQLEGRMPILGSVITQRSRGRIDANGLAPLRFTDRRLRRDELEVRFLREQGQILVPRKDARHPLLPGSQDRLSWMLQLAAIAAASPEHVRSQPVSFFVVGARGDASVWTFRFAGQEMLKVGDQTVHTLRLVREPRRPGDTRIAIWLAPGAHHLPVRAEQTESDGDTFALSLSTLPAHLRK